jgi:hypothetical protein
MRGIVVAALIGITFAAPAMFGQARADGYDPRLAVKK